MSESPLEELLAIVRRDLGAVDVRLADSDVAPAAASVGCEVPGGRRIVADFAEPPVDPEACQRRLEVLVASFAAVLSLPADRRSSRPPAADSLHDELTALAQRSGAVEALVIDAHSPVVWGSAGEQVDLAAAEEAVAELRVPGVLREVGRTEAATSELAHRHGLASVEGLRLDPRVLRAVPIALCRRHRVVPVARRGGTLVLGMADPADTEALYAVSLVTGLEVEPVVAGPSTLAFLDHVDDDDARTYDEVLAAVPEEARSGREIVARRARDAWARLLAARHAIALVRGLAEMESLHKGGHLHHTSSDGRFGVVARSFAAIYVVILAFDGEFEELRAKRALQHALPAIERLVLALPPLEPPPRIGGVVALRRPRRR